MAKATTLHPPRITDHDMKLTELRRARRTLWSARCSCGEDGRFITFPRAVAWIASHYEQVAATP